MAQLRYTLLAAALLLLFQCSSGPVKGSWQYSNNQVVYTFKDGTGYVSFPHQKFQRDFAYKLQKEQLIIRVNKADSYICKYDRKRNLLALDCTDSQNQKIRLNLQKYEEN